MRLTMLRVLPAFTDRFISDAPRRAHGWLLLCAFGLAAAACVSDKDNGDDDVPPRLLGITPSDAVVPVSAGFQLSFSESLNPKTVNADPASTLLSIVLVPITGTNPDDVVFSDDLLTDLDNPPLSASRVRDVVPVEVSLGTEDTVLSIVPRGDLVPNRSYALIVNAVRDTAGNPLVNASGQKEPFVWLFSTDSGRPNVRSTSIDGGIVAPNIRQITITFDQAVSGVDLETLVVEPVGNAAPPSIEAVLMDETATRATVVFGEVGPSCERLTPEGTYTLRALEAIRGVSGQSLESAERAFDVSASCDLTPVTISNLSVIPSDVSALVRLFANKPSTIEVRFGHVGGALDCLGAPCPVMGEPSRMVDSPQLVTLAGLSVDTDYAFVVSVSDEVGSVASERGTFRTARLPKVTINEAMANPSAVSDGQGEFVELVNTEDSETLDLSGWTLRVTKLPASSGDTPNTAVIPAQTVLRPGSFVILADTTFLPETYPGLQSSSVVAFTDFDGLQNQAILLELEDASGRIVSSMTSPAPKEGYSIERIRPDAPDEPASFCFSRDDTGPTPGRDNGVALRGCE